MGSSVCGGGSARGGRILAGWRAEENDTAVLRGQGLPAADRTASSQPLPKRSSGSR